MNCSYESISRYKYLYGIYQVPKQFRCVRCIFDAIEDGKLTAVSSVGSMYTNAYLVTLYLKENEIHKPRQTEKLRLILNTFRQIAPTVDCSDDTIKEAINDEQFTDIEDSFQYHCALQHDCDVLLTINIKDYKNVLDSKTEVMTQQGFVEKYLK